MGDDADLLDRGLGVDAVNVPPPPRPGDGDGEC